MKKFFGTHQQSIIAGAVIGLIGGGALFFGEYVAYAGYGQGGYYGQGTYYSQGSYYAQGSYGPVNPLTYTFEYEPNGYCVQVVVVKKNSHPRTTIHSDGFNVPCDDIETSARTLQRSVELTY